MRAGDVLVITGPPGAGKSTVARALVDAVLGPWHLDTFVVTLGLPCGYGVLRTDRSTTVERAVGRSEGALTDVATVQFMWEQFADLGDHESHVIDTSALDVGATVDAVFAAAPKSPLVATPD